MVLFGFVLRKIQDTINSLKAVIRMATRKVPIKAVLIDLSGTLHVENSAIPGAIDSLKRCMNDLFAVGRGYVIARILSLHLFLLQVARIRHFH